MSKKENNKISINKFSYIVSLMLALLVGVGGTFVIKDYISSKEQPGENIVESNSFSHSLFEQTGELSAIDKMYTILKNNYYEDLDSTTLIEGALEGMAKAVDDPYTEYMNEEETTHFEEDISGSFQGIGAEVMKDEEGVRIVSPITNSPAEEAGLQANDLILEIDDEKIAELSLQEAVSLIRGPEDSEVKLLIQRGDDTFTVKIIRANIPVETVFYNVDEDDSSIGYVNIVNFNLPTYDETVQAIKDLQKQNVNKIIFDVRGNPGGLLSTALEISNIFVPEGEPLMMTETRNEKEPFVYYANDEEYGDFKYEGDAVLLVDQGSASASEILAGAMQSVGIEIHGETTFGKGTVQSVMELEEHNEIKFTNGKWLTADGDWINEKGIQPDKTVKLPDYSTLFIVTTSDNFKKGEKGPEIKNLNSVLSALGYQDNKSEKFEQNTIDAIEEFQNDFDLPVDGKVTKDTARQLTDQLRQLIEENDTQYESAFKAFN